MWAEAERYYYRGRMIARTKGGGLYQQPEVIYTETEEGIPEGVELIPVDIAATVSNNIELLVTLRWNTSWKAPF